MLPWERRWSRGIGSVAWDIGFCLKCNSQLTLIPPPPPHSPGFLERCGRCVCGCVCEGVLCYWGRKCIDCVSVCVCTVEVHMHGCVSTNKRQPHRSRCCDPAPGAGRRSRAPLTGGSTTSHSSADGPVYSATHGDTGRVSSRQRAIPR